ncbi:hypothetical protein [Streptomyces sp. NPDC050263]|uniref:hypothetical protein n=1 Tax=Streptomyces sp. NPDC050263 TaxID=3155037 RepID=UPI003443ED82
MNRYRRTFRIARTAALALAAAACWSAVGRQWWLADGFGYLAFVCAWIGGNYAGLHRIERARHDRARRASGTEGPLQERPVPCCSFWRNSNGAVHGPDCARRGDEPRVYDGRPLDERETAVFTAIAARYDHGSRA